MAGTQLLRVLVSQRLEAAVKEIFGLVEETIARYEDEAVRSKREIQQLKSQLEQLTVLKPGVVLYRAVTHAAFGEVLPPKQPDQLPIVEENGTFNCQQVKEEQEDLCIFSHPMEQSSEDVKIKPTEPETSTLTDCNLFPTFSNTNVTFIDEDALSISYASSDLSPNYGNCVSMEQDQMQSADKACRVCGEQFNTDSDLIRHMEETHVGEKAFKCSYCNKEFARKGYLTVHTRVHTGEKPHKCHLCRKSFTQRSNLNVHFRKHTGEKPYFCKSCGKMVAYSYHLKTCGATET